ncbi:hypothetical protein RHMOL_Rhmol02G0156200 [Rhododendron molle]|uniref:Uncharacterized protein n=1 Tax=Rhododendron molle TaxID=49168 RepID=A0ACC0PS91_RHOML|nr:hypothetical protein RHMOL_Rhmol02G0156200 [Rhododendron molle]
MTSEEGGSVGIGSGLELKVGIGGGLCVARLERPTTKRAGKIIMISHGFNVEDIKLTSFLEDNNWTFEIPVSCDSHLDVIG